MCMLERVLLVRTLFVMLTMQIKFVVPPSVMPHGDEDQKRRKNTWTPAGTPKARWKIVVQAVAVDVARHKNGCDKYVLGPTGFAESITCEGLINPITTLFV